MAADAAYEVSQLDAIPRPPVSYGQPRPGGHANHRKIMAEGYCVRCKAKKEIADAVEEVMKNGRRAIKGKCPTCGAVMFKILGGKSSTPSAPAGSSVPQKPPATPA